MDVDHRDQVLIVYLLLAVGQLGELGVQRVQFIVAQLDAKLLEAIHQRVPSRMLAQHDAVGRHAHRLRRHDLVAERIAEHTMLVNAGLMGKSIASDNRLVRLHAETQRLREQFAGGVELRAVDAALVRIDVVADVYAHHDLFHRGIAGAFADSVHRALHLARPCSNRGQRISHRQAKIVVAVAGDGQVLALYGLLDLADQPPVFLGHRIAHRVRNVQRGSAAVGGHLQHLAEEIRLRAGGVLGRKLNILAQRTRVGDIIAHIAQAVLAGHLQLVLQMNVAGSKEGVNAGTRRLFQGLPGGVDVLAGAAAQTRYPDAADLARYALYGLEIAMRGDGKAGLNDVHTEPLQLPGQHQFLFGVHAAAGRLLAVAQGRVKDEDLLWLRLHVGVHLSTFDAAMTLVKLLFLQHE